MKAIIRNAVLAASAVYLFAGCRNHSEKSAQALVDDAGEVFVHNGIRYPDCKRMFNGENYEGWIADPSTWTIVDGAMQGVKGRSRLAYTEEDYGSFRLIVSGRLVGEQDDHLGVLFWGDRPQDPVSPKIDNAGWIQFMPPFAMMWDYHPPKHSFLESETLAPVFDDWDHKRAWCVSEIVCNLEEGTMRAAVDGVEVTKFEWKWPSERVDPEKRIVAGPIGLFRHGRGTSQYKDVYIEANPRNFDLITVAKGDSQ